MLQLKVDMIDLSVAVAKSAGHQQLAIAAGQCAWRVWIGQTPNGAQSVDDVQQPRVSMQIAPLARDLLDLTDCFQGVGCLRLVMEVALKLSDRRLQNTASSSSSILGPSSRLFVAVRSTALPVVQRTLKQLTSPPLIIDEADAVAAEIALLAAGQPKEALPPLMCEVLRC